MPLDRWALKSMGTLSGCLKFSAAITLSLCVIVFLSIGNVSGNITVANESQKKITGSVM
jgi:hypothetical protein